MPGAGPPRVSVVVAVRDEAAALDRLVASLAEQDLEPGEFEVVVADDGSREPVVLAAEREGWLRVTRGAPATPYAARNRAAGLARGAVLAFTDADCKPRPDWLRAGLAAMEDADLVGGHIDVVVAPRPTAWSIVDATLFDQERFVAMGKAATANLFIRRALLEAHSGFDESLPSGGDWDLIDRCVQAGARLRYAPDAVIEHGTRSRALPFLRRRWRIERAFGMRRGRAGLPLRAVATGREAVVPRRFGFVVGFDPRRVTDVGVRSVRRSRFITILPRYVVIPAVDALAQGTGWLLGRARRR